MTDIAAAGEAPADDKADDIETKARDQGWRPKEEWTGKPEHWKDAATYVEHGDLKSRLAKAEDRLSRVDKTTAKAIDNLKKQHEAQITALKAEKKAAVKAGNVEAVEKIDDKLEELKAETTEKGAEADEDKHEVQADWLVENTWYESDEAMTRYAMTISQGYAEQHPKASMKENLLHVDKKMRAKFPDYEWGKKTAPERKAGANGHAPVDGGGAFPGFSKKTGLTANDLPAEAKEVGASFVKQGLYKDMGEYAKEYWKNA